MRDLQTAISAFPWDEAASVLGLLEKNLEQHGAFGPRPESSTFVDAVTSAVGSEIDTSEELALSAAKALDVFTIIKRILSKAGIVVTVAPPTPTADQVPPAPVAG